MIFVKVSLYPNANILVATKNDFTKENRQKLCAKIATGDFDAVIIGHSQITKKPVSIERQQKTIEEQIEDLRNGIVPQQGWWITSQNQYRFAPGANYIPEIKAEIPMLLQCRESSKQSNERCKEVPQSQLFKPKYIYNTSATRLPFTIHHYTNCLIVIMLTKVNKLVLLVLHSFSSIFQLV